MSVKELVNNIVDWMSDYHNNSGQSCWVVGISGGIDSAVATVLGVKTEIPIIGINMPIWLYNYNDSRALNRATQLANQYDKKGLDFCVREIGPIVEAYKKCGISCLGEQTKLREGNLRSRIRANILYDFANENKGLVIGTGNKDEDEIGYFTKGGDGLVDICPLSDLHKSTVYEIGEYLEVPSSILNAVPSAGLWDGQTDEKELGMTYEEIEWALDYDDHYVPTIYMEPREQEILLKVRQMRKNNAHKLQYPPVFNC